MSKTADRLDRIEAKLDEMIALLRILVLRGGSDLPSDDDDDYIPAPRPVPGFPPHLPVPDPVQPWQPSITPNPMERSTTCSKCDMEFKGVMGYVCPNADCPMGCGPITC